jgi:hypothetical protein
MQTEHLIPADSFCIHHNIELSFIHSLHSTGLIEVVTIEQSIYIDTDQIERLEKYVRLHVDMGINLEGIEAISHLLYRVDALQNSVRDLKNKLRLYESL